jgi:hypothetical protein
MVFDGSTTNPIQKAGIAYAKQKPEIRYKGRKPSYTRAQSDIVRTMLDQHHGVSAITRATDLSRQTILSYRVVATHRAASARTKVNLMANLKKNIREALHQIDELMQAKTARDRADCLKIGET